MGAAQEVGADMRGFARVLKWIGDRIAAAILLMVFSPLILICTLWILIDDGRPVLFIQRRSGKAGKPFSMWKFRSMVNNAIEIGREMKISDDPFGIVYKDPRITRAGRWLRRTGLDELPQLWNVLIGQMSLVGPRPDLVEQAAHYTESDSQRLAVLPGITGYSQVHGRDEIGWPQRIRQDIWYISNWSLRLDISLLLATIGQVFRSEPDPIVDTLNIERAKGHESMES